MQDFIEKLREAMQSWFVAENVGGWLSSVLQAAIILLAAFVVLRIVRHFLKRARKKTDNPRNDTYLTLAQSVSRYLVYFLAGIAILNAFGMNVTAASLLATAGVGGIIISLGVQGLVKDMVTGSFLLFEDQYRVGDYVKIGDITGTVEQLAVRTTQIRCYTGEITTIPNGQVDIVTNYSRSALLAVVEIDLSRNKSFEELTDILNKAVSPLAQDARVLEAPCVVGITALAQNNMTVRVTCKCKELQHWGIEREMRALLVQAVLEHGIAPPSQVIKMEN